MKYYYAEQGADPLGPIEASELHQLYRDGSISADTFVMGESEQSWTTYGTLNPDAASSVSLVPEFPRNLPRMDASPAVQAPQRKECPFCSEDIAISAKKCRHCGEILDPTLRAAEEAKRSSSNQPMVFMNAGGAVSESKKSFPHLLHLLVTLITMGFWFPIWVLHYLFRDRKTYG